MSHTVIGIFKNPEKAQEAKRYLTTNGFSDSSVDLSNPRAGSTASSATTERDRKDRNESSDDMGHFFDNLFGNDKEESGRYQRAGRQGTIVTVHARNEEEAIKASRILDNYGAIDVNESEESHHNKEASSRGAHGTERESIPVIEEELQVGKRQKETGGVRIRSKIVERPVEEKIRLRNEHVSVERRPVDRPATEKDMESFKEGTTEVTGHKEVPVVSKDSRVVEEVNLEKNVEESEETIRDTVRGTRVETDEYDDRNRSREDADRSGRTGENPGRTGERSDRSDRTDSDRKDFGR